MSESLAWEKWSAFSHNRYMEEVEKFSKPGSVAQKKAYFEAHYKRKAAQKAAAELEGVNTAAAMTQVETEDKSCTSPCVDSEPMRPNNQVIETDEKQDFVQNAEFVSTTDADADAHDSMNEESMVETGKVEEEEEVIDQNETSPNVESANQCENVEDHGKIAVAEDKETPAKVSVMIFSSVLIGIWKHQSFFSLTSSCCLMNTAGSCCEGDCLFRG